MKSKKVSPKSTSDQETKIFQKLTNLKCTELDKMLRDAKIPGRSKARRKAQKIALLLQHAIAPIAPSPQPKITPLSQPEIACTKEIAPAHAYNYHMDFSNYRTFKAKAAALDSEQAAIAAVTAFAQLKGVTVGEFEWLGDDECPELYFTAWGCDRTPPLFPSVKREPRLD
jgi:hypothetical protein